MTTDSASSSTTKITGQEVVMTTSEPDFVAILIYAICKHFIWDSNKLQERSSEILIKLTFPKLQDFLWYKDMFLNKVFLKTYCNYSYWKEKILAGLPKLFVENVRQRIRELHNGQIPYSKLTCGDLINFINFEGQSLCVNLKLKKKIKGKGLETRRELE